MGFLDDLFAQAEKEKKRKAFDSDKTKHQGAPDAEEYCYQSDKFVGELECDILRIIAKQEKKRKPFDFDKAKYQWDSAAQEYCYQFNKSIEELKDDDYRIIREYCGNHIAFFLTWVIQNGFYNPPEKFKAISEAAEEVKSESMTGTEFLIQCCDGVLLRKDLKPEIHGFADFYYQDYLNDYTDFVEKKLHKRALGIGFSWEEYHQFQHIIDLAYKMYLMQSDRAL